MFDRTPESETADDLSARWDRARSGPRPERTWYPPIRPEKSEAVATHLDAERRRARVTPTQVADLRAKGVPVLDDWQSLDITSNLYAGGVVVMDVRP